MTPFYEPPPAEEDRRTCTTFANEIRVELRRDGSRWLMFVGENGKRMRRRKDFATPYLDHGRRSAEHFYGPPCTPWAAPSKET